MPSLPRCAIICDGASFHVTWQCHNKDWLLKDEWAKQLYYDLLLEYKDRYNITFYGYSLMDSHPHLEGVMQKLGDFSSFFQRVNSIFAKRLNKRLGRCGQVVMNRFKSVMIQTERHMLNVMIYDDLNEMRAGKVGHPRDNEFSSYSYYAYGTPDPLLTPAPVYLALADSDRARQRAYRAIVDGVIKNDWRHGRPNDSLPFIGDPDWVMRKMLEIRRIRREKMEAWRKRFKDKYG